MMWTIMIVIVAVTCAVCGYIAGRVSIIDKTRNWLLTAAAKRTGCQLTLADSKITVKVVSVE